MTADFKRLPSVDKVLSDRRTASLGTQLPHEMLVAVIREVLSEVRAAASLGHVLPSYDQIVNAVAVRVDNLLKPSLHRIINASGVLLHTNLGRAPVSEESAAAMEAIGRGYCNLEYEIASGTRGSRHIHLERLLCRLTGAEAALVVNNNAGAVLLILSALAKRKEVIVSRGQAVEIGGGFRIPDVMRQSGAKLVEVGTTNCTYAADYENAITSGTAALLRVHRSNFRVSGFTHDIELEELTDIAARHNLILIDDLGSGCFLDVTQFGLAPEPLVQKSIALGAITCFSGDKLVGGPQAGIIAGKKMCIDKIKKHPLARALRFDKVRTAGMEVTLGHYLKNEALQKIPVWRIISTPIDDIQRRAAAWAESLGCIACVIEGETMIGGGSMPGASIPTKLLVIGSKGNVPSQKFVQDLVKKLRAYSPAIIGRVDDNVLLLDPRTVLPEEDETVLKALRTLCLS